MANTSRVTRNSKGASPSSGSASVDFWERLVTIHASVLERLDEELSRTDEVSVMEYQVLDCLAAVDGSLSMSIIAARCGISLGRLSHVAKRLENRALLNRRLSEEDKRVTTAEITASGAGLLEELRVVYEETVRTSVLSELSPGEQRRLMTTLEGALRGIAPDHWVLAG